jgi:tellurite resistance protein
MNPKLDVMRFAPEQEKLAGIMQRFGLEPLLAHFESEGGLGSLRDYVLGSQLKLSPTIAPRIFPLLNDVRSRLQYDQPIDLFVGAEQNINACAIYSLDNSPHIISLTSSLVEKMNDEELRFVLGHEIGHIHFAHYRARLVAQAVGQNEKGESRMPNLLKRRMEIWNRLCELSADRCGFAAVNGKMAPIVSAFFKSSSGLGPEFLNFDVSAFLQQLEELKNLEKRDLICGFSHPVTPIRVKALQLFGQVGGPSASPEALKAVDTEVTSMAKLMEISPSSPMDLNMRDFLLSAGVLVGHADGRFSQDEKDILVEILLPLTSDPEVEIDAMDSAEKANGLLGKSAAWLRENAGEQRFLAYRYLTHVAAVDGALKGDEEQVLMQVAELAGIPGKSAREIVYESLACFLQARRSGGDSGHRFQMAA